MPAYRVTWTQPTTATAEISIELDELARWAIASNVIHTLVNDAGTPPDPVSLQRALELNPHLRDGLLRLWATTHS
ncbi:hypothetical protein [Microbacterium maritypicum]|uniref:hypothetical protein n=1 Tax=Microbacterium maritypicum TaxID=33918 RepID=UPI003A8F1E07